MIGAHGSWDTLLPALRGSGRSGLDDVPDHVAQAVMAGPVAVAWWIARRTPALAQRSTLRLLVAGAEKADAPDEGRWYQLLPLLLGVEMRVEVALVGLELDPGFRSAAAAHAPDAPARAFPMSLEVFLSQDAPPVDLAVAFHPGLQKHRGWLSASGFAALLGRGVPVVCAAYESDEQEMEHWVVSAYGYRAPGDPLLNPFVLDLSDARTSIRWAHALWQIESAPAPGAEPDAAKLQALETLNRMVMHSLARAGPPAPGYGAPLELGSSAGHRLRLVHIADHRFLNPASGELLRLADGALQPLHRIPAATCASYPGDDAPEIERAVWAAGIKHAHLLETYEAPVPRADCEIAADMLAELRAKIERLFAGH